jgi:hypothetical protein
MSNLQTMMEAAQEAARQTIRAGEQIPLTYICETSDGRELALEVPFIPRMQVLADTLRQLFADAGIVRYITIGQGVGMAGAELEQSKKDGTMTGRTIDLLNHPDRREMVYILGEERNGPALVWAFYVLRPEHGRPVLAPPITVAADETAGFPTGLLKPAPQRATSVPPIVPDNFTKH